MLTIRLQRAGKKNKAEYRVILAEKTAAAQKKFVEILGNYNPHTKTLGIRNPERLNYWITANNFHDLVLFQNTTVNHQYKKVDSWSF